MDITTQQLYVLLSGRWYTAATQAGPWSFIASNALPSDFTNIPSNSPKAAVLASVSGTAAANNAVLDASVPQTAAVKRDAKAPDVKYDGDPKFQDVQGTSMQYAREHVRTRSSRSRTNTTSARKASGTSAAQPPARGSSARRCRKSSTRSRRPARSTTSPIARSTPPRPMSSTWATCQATSEAVSGAARWSTARAGLTRRGSVQVYIPASVHLGIRGDL